MQDVIATCDQQNLKILISVIQSWKSISNPFLNLSKSQDIIELLFDRSNWISRRKIPPSDILCEMWMWQFFHSFHI